MNEEDEVQLNLSKTIAPQSEKKNGVTRRNFLRAIFLGIATLFLKNSTGSFPNTPDRNIPTDQKDQQNVTTQEEEPEVVDVPTPQERFEALKMSEFWSFYTLIQDTTHKFGAKNDAYFFNRIFTVCQQVAEGTLDNSDDLLLTDVRDGWGEKQEKVLMDALSHIKSLQIQNHDVTGDPEVFRNQQLTTFAKVFGSMALALPHEIYITKMDAQTSAEQLVTVSFDEWGVGEAWDRFFHEVTHSTDVFSERVQPYVSKESFLDYASTYYHQADELLSKWLNTSDLDQAREFWEGYIRSWGGDITTNRTENERLVATLEKEFLNQDFSDESLLYRFQRVSWTLGRKIQEIRRKQSTDIQLTTEEKNLIDNSDVQTLMTMTLEETLHFLVSVPENTFSGSATDYTYPEGNEARIAVNEVRVKTFGTFELNQNQPVDQQIRNNLGIE